MARATGATHSEIKHRWREGDNNRYCRYKILSGECFLIPGVLDLVVDIIALGSDVLNLGGDVGVLISDVRDLGVDIGDLAADV